MTKIAMPLFLIIASSAHVASAQVPAQAAVPAIVGGGYSIPNQMLRAAPGQVMSLMIYGLSYTVQTPVVAAATPLPTTLAGFSASLKQTALSAPIPIPLLSIQQQSQCTPSYLGGPCPVLTILSLQIPFEAVTAGNCGACGPPPILSALVVSQDGVEQTSVPVDILSDNLHVTSSCDTTLVANSGGSCTKYITHGTGIVVDSLHPAAQGEELAVYAFGLGAPGSAATGHVTPQGAAALPADSVTVTFEFPASVSPISTHPAYVGLVPGFVALYQINVRVPNSNTSLPGCNTNGANATMAIIAANSQDSTGICVMP